MTRITNKLIIINVKIIVVSLFYCEEKLVSVIFLLGQHFPDISFPAGLQQCNGNNAKLAIRNIYNIYISDCISY